jgi:Tfp pilus assembly protein PilF
MRIGAGRVLIVAATCLIGATGCGTSTQVSGFTAGQRDEPVATASIEGPGDGADPTTTGSIGAPAGTQPPHRNPSDDLNLGKKHFRTGNFVLAEQHFRRAVELQPRDAESWLGLAAAYDRLKRFELADRAYMQATSIAGDTPEIMNNRGYSYLLRGDYGRARRTLEAAQARAPDNPYIKNNLALLEKTQRRGKSAN